MPLPSKVTLVSVVALPLLLNMPAPWALELPIALFATNVTSVSVTVDPSLYTPPPRPPGKSELTLPINETLVSVGFDDSFASPAPAP